MSSMADLSNSYLEKAQALQARRMEYLARKDIAGLVRDLYTDDARLDSFAFHFQGQAAIEEMTHLILERMDGLGARRVENFVAGRDFIWQELIIETPQGEIRPYEVKFLRGDRIYLQLYGFKQGTLWRSGDFSDAILPDTRFALELHDHYVSYHIRGQADALVDEFFSPDARLVTSNLAVEGRDALRGVFRELFDREQNFQPISVEQITCGPDYVWFEATVESSLGRRSLYDVQMLSGQQVSLQIVGLLDGVMPTEAARIQR
jgi:hypothetical protein